MKQNINTQSISGTTEYKDGLVASTMVIVKLFQFQETISITIHEISFKITEVFQVF
jgi:hypothetical protein